MRAHRMIAILMMIERQKSVKAKELALALEVSARTIYRDIDTLAEAGFPVYATTGPNGGIRFRGRLQPWDLSGFGHGLW